MSNNDELDFEIVESLDGDDETIEDTNEQEESSNTTSEVETKNPSNFKKMAKAYKWAQAKIKELEAKLASGKVQPTQDEGSVVDQSELRFFMIENPEAKEYKNQIQEILEAYPIMTLEDALALAKVKKPQTSTDKDDFSFNAKNTKVKKRLEDLSLEEALKLDNKTYFEWTQKTKKTSNNDLIWGN